MFLKLLLEHQKRFTESAPDHSADLQSSNVWYFFDQKSSGFGAWFDSKEELHVFKPLAEPLERVGEWKNL